MKAKAELTSGVISRKLVARFVRMTVDDSSLSIAFATREADRSQTLPPGDLCRNWTMVLVGY